MQTADFDYTLPPHLIAQHPAERRDESRMMTLEADTGRTEHGTIRDFPHLLNPGDALVINNTRVIPARTFGHKETGGKVECLFVEPVEGRPEEWWVMMKSSHRPKPGSTVSLEEVVDLEVLENRSDGLNRVRVSCDGPLLDCLERIGEPPLPPYIEREHLAENDSERYQTVYASKPGAVAAPTAGLHFTPELLEEIRARGVSVLEITLHVGPGTFRPVTSDTVEAHTMDAERYEVSDEVAEVLNQTRQQGRRVFAVGSTSVRTLETVYREGQYHAGSGRSDLYIYPPYTYRAVDAILTNFHLPKSTLLMMMSAFTTRERLMAAYREAVERKYRFFSYGDCMVLMHEDS
jgi:S-adenosylmethionine:tRNA ribosyltransferase-isomerase